MDEHSAGFRRAITRFVKRRSSGPAGVVWQADEESVHIQGQLDEMWNELESLRYDPVIQEFRQAALQAGRTDRLPWNWLAAACVAIFAVSTLWLIGALNLISRSPEVRSLHFASPAAHPAQIALADGSTVVLDAAAAMDVQFGTDVRKIDLESGRAYFRVKPDAGRPFVVSHGGKSVTAIGTEFAVDVAPQQLDIVLTKGRVRVTGSSSGGGEQAVEMTSGYRLHASGDANWQLSRVDTTALTAWVHGQLVFSDWTLRDIAKEMNRYSARHIVIDNSQVADARMSGVLNLGDVDTFVAAVEAQGIANAIWSGANTVHIGKKAPSAEVYPL